MLSDSASERSSAPLLGGCTKTVGQKAKLLWKNLKEENEQRKTEALHHVTSEEATAITGHGEGGSKSNTQDRKGDKKIAAAFTLF